MKDSLRKRLKNLAEWLGISAIVFLAVWQFAPVDWLTWVVGFGAALAVVLVAGAFSWDEARFWSMHKRRAGIDDPSHRISVKKTPHADVTSTIAVKDAPCNRSDGAKARRHLP